MKRTTPIDVVVAGAGPAGLAVAGALADRGRSVAVVDPSPEGRWPATYCAFEDEIAPLGLADCVANRWSRPLVHLDDGPARVLDRTYVRLDNDKLAARLREPLAARGGTLVEGRVQGVSTEAGTTTVSLGDGTTLTARVVVDATGSSRLVGAGASCDVAQVALGRVVELASVPWQDGEAVWMDFRDVPDPDEPTFLYVLPLGGRRVLLEETSLASSPPLTLGELGRRLDRRIASLGLEVVEVLEEEHVRIALDAAVHAPDGPVVGYGAAAAFVHPSTGYSVVRSLRRADAFAKALSDGLEVSPVAAARQAHGVAWSTRDRVVRALHHAGLQVLLGLDAAHTRRFFDAFFHLPPELQAAWLDPTGQPMAVARAMATLFGQASWGVRSDVFFGALEGLTPSAGPRAIQPGGSP